MENVLWDEGTGSGGGGPLSQSTGIHSTVKDLSQNLAVNLVFDAESVYASYNAFNNGRTVEGIAYLGLGIIGTVNPFGKAWKLGRLAFGRVFRAGKSVTPNPAQLKNINRFQKKVPANAKKNIQIHQLPSDGIAVQATSPGRVLGSKAVYEK